MSNITNTSVELPGAPRGLGIHYGGVQWEGGTMDGGSII